mmetsp:Transcript_52288/g.124732  ORF Transcript_52288/g.124732 Transcript_52288/m.124732 type:complete len:186 (+) Transcript_52288:104-661(+)|eukprot:CAMPEP_0178437692 /NCGR_PEP_ID=MMETSP0689_2-20121128/35149_1 /TAXON_ID=160604 /ORGANISM="Amphidinium massartii, Strain CS-259" /LENGTH=185 /DNA_ID=CAMNT_0020059953 /DNA_START=102 /DNA_END=659 /DNA_ORIENTATION=+
MRRQEVLVPTKQSDDTDEEALWLLRSLPEDAELLPPAQRPIWMRKRSLLASKDITCGSITGSAWETNRLPMLLRSALPSAAARRVDRARRLWLRRAPPTRRDALGWRRGADPVEPVANAAGSTNGAATVGAAGVAGTGAGAGVGAASKVIKVGSVISNCWGACCLHTVGAHELTVFKLQEAVAPK